MKKFLTELKSRLHTWESFIEHGLHERSTYVGLVIIIFGFLYHTEINTLIKNILTSPQLTSAIIDTIATLFGTILVIFKSKK
jgi:nicotinamide riboside transporter PnuC